MITGEIRCKYCGEKLVTIDGEYTFIGNVVVQEEFVFCGNCKNVIKSDILKLFLDVVYNIPSSLEKKGVTLDNLYEELEKEDEILKSFEGLPKVTDKLIIRRVFSDNNKIYENCTFVIGQIRDCTNVMIKNSTIYVPASALLKCYPLIKECESIAIEGCVINPLESLLEEHELLKYIPFDVISERVEKEVGGSHGV